MRSRDEIEGDIGEEHLERLILEVLLDIRDQGEQASAAVEPVAQSKD